MTHRTQFAHRPHFGARRRIRRSAAVTLEAILGLPLLLIAVLAVFVFAAIMVAHSGVVNAAIEAAREASKVNCTVANPNELVRDTAVSTANQILGVYGANINCADPVNSTAMIIIEDYTGVKCCGSCPDPFNPPFSIACPGPTPIGDTDIVRVRILVPFTSIPIPNLLVPFCSDLSGRYFDVCSDARRLCFTSGTEDCP